MLEDLVVNDVQLLDSCLALYHNSTNDTDRVIALEGICENLMSHQWEEYQFLQFDIIAKNLKQPLPLYQKIKYINYFSGAISNIANIYTNKGDYDKAEKYHSVAVMARDEYAPSDEIIESLMGLGYFYMMVGKKEKAIPLYKKCVIKEGENKNYENVGRALQNLAYIYQKDGAYEKALHYYEESLSNFKKENYQKGIGEVLVSLGAIHLTQNNNVTNIKYLEQAVVILEEIGALRGLATAYNNLGAAHRKQKDLTNTIKYFKKGLEIQKKIGDVRGEALSLNNIGYAYYRQNKQLLAIDLFGLSLEKYSELDDEFGMSLVHSGMATLLLRDYEETNDKAIYKKAKKHAIKSYSLAKKIGSPKMIRDASYGLSKIYVIENNGMKALELYKESMLMRDSLNNESTQKATAQQQAKYEYEKQKVLDDAAHDKLLAIEQEEKEKQQILTGATAGGLGLVILFLIFVFNRLRVTKKQKRVIEEQKREVEQQKEVVELAHSQLAEKNQEIMDSITYAKRIQNAILPPAKVVKEYLQESFILYKPKDIVAGDFYWLESVAPISNNKETKVLFAAADCTGHGVPGAMVSVVCNNALNRSVREHGLTDPGKILDKTREIVIEEFEKSDEEVKDGMDIAICSLEGNTLKYAGAHNPLWIVRNGEILETKANKQPIGQFDNPEPYTTHTFELQKGDAIYIFSDGYVDQFGGEKGKKFKARAFRELLLSIQDKKMEEQKTIIDESFETWRGNLEQIDDVCIIGVRI
ncbi:MAG: tetratricopeptide repeat protein [Flavobacteriales bacterium]|nr:tetratricopeptide repeat protein [Flavobacteriales bacterium]